MGRVHYGKTKMQVFVTGASGFIGSAVASSLFTAGHKVRGLVRNRAKADAVAAHVEGGRNAGWARMESAGWKSAKEELEIMSNRRGRTSSRAARSPFGPIHTRAAKHSALGARA
jgi:NAD(P)-dependent dehydrogenase (short-subunit alcohol dehydrogenase family)